MKKNISTSLLLLFFINTFSQFNPGKSLIFDGTAAYVLTSYPGIPGGASRSIEAWIKPSTSSGTGQRVIWDYGDMATSSRFTSTVQQTLRNFRTEIGGNGNQGVATLSDGKWHHVAVVYDANASIKKVTTYVDGVQDWNGDFTISVTTGNTNTFRLGVRQDGVNYFIGEIDEVRFWSSVRTAAEIKDNMFGRIATSNPDLVAYYDFDAAAIGTDGVPDLVTGNTAHPATLNNMSSSEILSSTAPIHALTAINDVKGIWTKTPTGTSSLGLAVLSQASLTDGNTATYGHINTSNAVVTTDLPIGLSQRFEQVWAIDINGSVTTNINFNVSTVLGSSVNLGAPSTYHLLYRANTSGTFLDLGVANAILAGTQVQFTNINLQDGYYTMASDNLLPLKLIDFAAIKQNKNVLLQWQTSFEKNVNKFIIEKKNSSSNWNILGTALAKNSFNTKNIYQLVDENPNSGENFYRLTAVDNDGKTTISNIVTINMANISNIRLYPNPANKTIVIEGLGTDKNISIKNVVGQVMKCKIITTSNNNCSIDISNLNNGVYFVKTSNQQISFIKE